MQFTTINCHSNKIIIIIIVEHMYSNEGVRVHIEVEFSFITLN